MEKTENIYTLAEFAGGLGDLGTSLPIILGYILLLDFNPAGIFLAFGIGHMILAILYKVPLPLQPMKAISSLAIAESWNKEGVMGTGLAMGILCSIIASSKKLNNLVDRIPNSVVYGTILGLGIKLFSKSLQMISGYYLYAVLLIIVCQVMNAKLKIPKSIVLVAFGLFYVFFVQGFKLDSLGLQLATFEINSIGLGSMFEGLYNAVVIQLPLTVTNAVVATASLSKELFPNRSRITPSNLLTNMGLINLFAPMLGGVPMCHGSGGMYAHYSFGARTGGSILMLGALEVITGLFFANNVKLLLNTFPIFILGIMLLFTSTEFIRGIKKVRNIEDIIIISLTALISLFYNLSIGMVGGLVMYSIYKKTVGV